MAEIGAAFITVAPSMRGFGSSVQSQATRELDPAGKKIGSRFGGMIGLAAKAGLAAGAFALGAFAKASIGAASDAQQSIGATETVFGKFADTVIKSSEGAAQAYGLSANEYRENANLLGALFKNQGVALSDLGSSTDQMIGKASDLAATFGGTTADAVGALGAAFKGEFDSLERYGISLKESTVQAELAKRGQDGLTGAALAAAKQQAITDLIFKQSKDSLGAFGRESDTLAGQQQRLSAQFENIKATVGAALLPVLTQFFGYLNTTALPALSALGGYLRDNFGPAFDRVREIVAGFFGGTSGDAGEWANNIKSIVRDVVTIATKLWQTFGADIMRFATNAFNNVKQIVGGALNVIAGIFKTVSALMKGDWRGAWEGIKQITSGAKDVVVGIVKQLFNILQTAVSAGWKVVKGLFSTAWDGIKLLVSAGVDKVVGFVTALPGRIKSAVAGAFDGLVSAFRSAINTIIGGWNSLSFSLPGFDPPGPGSFPGITVSTPNIPMFAKGTAYAPGGLAIVGEQGPELVNLPRGSQVFPNGSTFAGGAVRLSRADLDYLAGRIGGVINGAVSDGQRKGRAA